VCLNCHNTRLTGQANENLPLTSLNVSRCPIDEKAMQSLTNFVRKSKQPITKVNVAETTGDKIGKAGGLQVSTLDIDTILIGANEFFSRCSRPWRARRRVCWN
jgi:hypothetical protein